MDKIKFFIENLGRNVKRFFRNAFIRSYGMDDLNKALIIGIFVLSILNLIFKSSIVYILHNIFFISFIFRYFSSNKIIRAEENKLFRKYVKLYKLKWQYRNTHKIFLCKKCKQIIRVPKGNGKIEVTCPSCGDIKTLKS